MPKKYDGLDGTELALSESQERMAVVLAAADVPAFIALAAAENLEATPVATVSSEQRLRMRWREKVILDVGRDFLNSAGVRRRRAVFIVAPRPENNFFPNTAAAALASGNDLVSRWLATLGSLAVCSQQGLVERFDASIGAATVLAPCGGCHQTTPAEGMAAKLPLLTGETFTGMIMTFGYNPRLARWSPFHGGMFAVVEALARAVACGGSHRCARLTLQEYFEKLGRDEVKLGQAAGSPARSL